MLTPSRLRTAVTATITATAALVLVSPPGVQAAPKEPATSSVSAPYSGSAFFRGWTSDCDDAGTICQITGSADAATGRSTTAGSYRRSQPISYGGGVFGYGRQEVSYSVPRGAKTVTAVLTYRVDSASAAAAPTAGYIHALSGVWASFPYESCVPPECKATSQQRNVASTQGPLGLPVPPQHVTVPRTETLTLTATGTLPRTLLLQGNTFVNIYGGGEYGLCLHWDGCDNEVYAHAGTADASIDATLLSVQFSAS